MQEANSAMLVAMCIGKQQVVCCTSPPICRAAASSSFVSKVALHRLALACCLNCAIHAIEDKLNLEGFAHWSASFKIQCNAPQSTFRRSSCTACEICCRRQMQRLFSVAMFCMSANSTQEADTDN